MLDLNSKPLRQILYFQMDILANSFPSEGGNLLLDTEPGGSFTFGERDMQRMTFGERIAEVFNDDRFEISKKTKVGSILLSKELFKKLDFNKVLLKFAADGHGELTFWNIENSATTTQDEQCVNPRFEARFTNFNPYALVAALAIALKNEFTVGQSTKFDIKAIESIPEIAKYMKQNEQSKYRV
jgi:hypothetical protein